MIINLIITKLFIIFLEIYYIAYRILKLIKRKVSMKHLGISLLLIFVVSLIVPYMVHAENIAGGDKPVFYEAGFKECPTCDCCPQTAKVVPTPKVYKKRYYKPRKGGKAVAAARVSCSRCNSKDIRPKCKYPEYKIKKCCNVPCDIKDPTKYVRFYKEPSTKCPYVKKRVYKGTYKAKARTRVSPCAYGCGWTY